MLRLGHWLRDGWAILGVALALLLGAELLYRAQGAIRNSLRSAAPPEQEDPKHPYATQAWWPGTSNWQHLIATRRRYDPYRGWLWARSYHTPYINIDSAGHRLTVQPAPRGPHPRRVFMLGGSAMWGYTVRDAFTIPSQVASRLRAAGLDVEVVNLAQPAYNVTQDVITLLLEMRAGNVPDAAVFLDGHNDAAGAWGEGHAGAVAGEIYLAGLFERREPGAWAVMAKLLNAHSELLQRLRRQVVPGNVPRPPGPVPPCTEIATQYRNMAREAAALGKEYGFATVFAYQPMLATTRKVQTPWERSIPPAAYGAILVPCAAATDSVMKDRLGRDYFPFHALYDRDTSSVYLDQQGHVTEVANGVIADTIAAILLPRLRRGHAATP